MSEVMVEHGRVGRGWPEAASAGERQALRPAAAVATVEHLVDLVDGVARHRPVGGELAAGDRHDPRSRHADAVAA